MDNVKETLNLMEEAIENETKGFIFAESDDGQKKVLLFAPKKESDNPVFGEIYSVSYVDVSQVLGTGDAIEQYMQMLRVVCMKKENDIELTEEEKQYAAMNMKMSKIRWSSKKIQKDVYEKLGDLHITEVDTESLAEYKLNNKIRKAQNND